MEDDVLWAEREEEEEEVKKEAEGSVLSAGLLLLERSRSFTLPGAPTWLYFSYLLEEKTDALWFKT